MEDLRIRLLEKEDLPQLLELYKQYDHDIAPLHSQQSIHKKWMEIEENPTINYFIGELAGKIVTSCFLLIIPQFLKDGMPNGLIENMISHTSYRKRGYASELLKHTIKIAWQHNCCQILLMSGNHGPEAVKLYENAGFKRDTKIGYVMYPDKKNDPIFLLRKCHGT